MRAVIYARYSTEHQREASIADQVEVCRRYAERQGWTITEIYEDAAISGASRFRPGFQRVLADAEAGRFDILVSEAIDRLGRKLSDVADLYDRLTFARVQIHTTSQGPITQMHIGIMGTMAQMMLSETGEKVRRGQLGRARAGRIPGGLAYGYEVVAPALDAKEGGERRIKPDEAAVIRRIFGEYAGGKSPRRIARDLNAEAVPGPDGRPWIDTTIRGQVDRGTGLLNNTLYIGRLSWNRCSYIKDPRTGRKVARVNPRAQWEEVEVPELRIIDQELWDRVKVRQSDVRIEMGRDTDGNALNRTHRREFLLSGILVCGCCGGGYTVVAKDRYGCATRRGKGTCTNSRTIDRQRIEARVLAALKNRLLTPDLVDEFVRALDAELADLQKNSLGTQARVQKQLADVERRLQGVLRAVENGAWNDSLRDRLTELETRKVDLTAQLSAAANPTPRTRLTSGAAEIYRAKVAGLEASLAAEEIRAEAGEALRSLIERVVLTPDLTAADGLAAMLYGELATILSLASGAQNEKLPGTSVPGNQFSVVAGTGFEPVTFRL
ncbi:recombinase family protein [Rhodovastum sp. RN2-1]|uniref:Recombinase family protein n=2 Tax=Limobrevibacterium gyesilva TaxID=2991712 RepID=A0AA42CG43_9PROT|nr:recombinase family protein [Limobrevibacterium gyesilva]MCW3477768.1 recombinase family protein [Limobrevibacterium gyesilva]